MLDSDGVASANEEPAHLLILVSRSTGMRIKLLEQLIDSSSTNKTAWDMYLVYNPGVIWKGSQPPKPTFYMHQMNSKHGTDPAKFLKPDVFYKNVQTILTKNNEEV